MKDNFYLLFEESFRGTRGLILDRLSIYDDFLIPMQIVHKGESVVDLGCGRCEWIEKMQTMGFAAHGVDLDAGMLQQGLDKGFNVHHGEALAYLRNLPDDSHAIISAFHLVEHISFQQLRELISQAKRVLKPAGLLIMETPNPENLVVATRNFYLDPTHQRPIPPELLTFLPRLDGFDRIKLVRLQEPEKLRHNLEPSLADVIGGASPDYAVVVQKNGDACILEKFNAAFAKDYGLSLQTLIERYDHFVKNQFKAVQLTMQSLNDQLEHAVKLSEEALAKSARATVMAQHRIRLGGIAAPLRWLRLQHQRLVEQGLRHRSKLFYVKVKNALRSAIYEVLQRHPVLRHKLLKTLNTLGLYAVVKRLFAVSHSVTMPALTPRAKQIRKDLKQAIAESGEA